MTETITTAEARDALPPGVIVRSAAGTIACRHDSGMGVCFGVEHLFEWDRLALPLTVLWRPDQPTPTVKPDRDTLATAIAFASGPMGTHYYDYALKAADAVIALLPDFVPTVRPSVEAVAVALFAWDTDEHPHPRPTWSDLSEDQRGVWRSGAQAVLALLPGRTVDEVWRAAWESCCLRSGVGRDEALADYLAGGE